MADVRIGVLVLVGAGLAGRDQYVGGATYVWPRVDLFATFNAEFMEWNPKRDARDLSVHVLNLDVEQVECSRIGASLGWPPRRSNIAAPYLVGARAADPVEHMAEEGFCR